MEDYSSLFNEQAIQSFANATTGTNEGMVLEDPRLKKEQTTVSLQDFLLLAVLGKGSYAKVVLVKKADTGQVYAMKILKKELILKRNQNSHVKTERNILASINHPFLVKLWWAFQNDRKLFFVLEYCPGGELFNLLQKRRILTEAQARFYAVQIILALEFLHKYDIVYRDLKPENVLLDQDGFIKLTDFGLSKMGIKGNHGTYSLCGTPEYLAPEVLFRSGHGKAVDWWTLGSLLYEMLTGLPPFYSQKREEVFERIKFGSVKYPKQLSAEAKDLIEGLLKKDPDRRLGGGAGDADEIKKHAWFHGVDWNAYLRKEVTAPFLPILSSELDISNFDPEFTQMSVDSMKETFVSSTEFQFGKFDGFTYDAKEHIEVKPQLKEDKMDIE